MLVSLVLGPSPFASPSDGVGAAIAVVMRMRMRETVATDRCGDLRCILFFVVEADTVVFT